MRICLICVEIFAWGKYGGFGRATRNIGRELAKRDHKVFAVVPRRQDQKPVENLDGITVLSFPRHNPFAAIQLFRQCDADIYHSSEPSFGTYLAMKTMPKRKHVVTCRDPRNWEDWKKEFERPAVNKAQVALNFIYENNFLVKKTVRRADKVCGCAKFLIPKIKSMYHLNYDPEFLPTPIQVPPVIQKAPTPTVGFLARWDRVKRPELFFELAGKFPDIKFIAGGHSRDKKRDKYLRTKYSNLPNLEMPGFVDQFTSNLHSQILGQCWVMVNTSAKEALPNAFIEASAHKCAILAGFDPDGFSSQFGYYVKNDNFETGLRFLLENNRWKKQGERGYQYVSDTFELSKSIDQHIQIYKNIL